MSNKDEKKHINKLTKTFMKKNGIGYNKAHKWAVKFVSRNKRRRYK
jgi:recombinational DNA repair protein RecR